MVGVEEGKGEKVMGGKKKGEGKGGAKGGEGRGEGTARTTQCRSQ